MVSMNATVQNVNQHPAAPLIQWLVGVAGDTPGQFVLCAIGGAASANPDGVLAVRFFPNEPNKPAIIAQMMRTVGELDGITGANVYYAPYLVHPAFNGPGRGTKKDIVARFAFVGDEDSHGGPPIDWQTKYSRLAPVFVTNTSPGNFQPFIALDRGYAVAELEPIGKALAKVLGDPDGVIGDMARVVRPPGVLNWPNQKKLKEGRSPEPFRSQLVHDDSLFVAGGWPLDALRAVILEMDPRAFDEVRAAADFDWDKALKEPYSPFDFGEAHEKLSNLKYMEDRSKGTFAFMKLCVRRGYTPEQVVECMMKHAGAPLMEHYGDPADEEKVRADVIRAFTKKDRPQRERTSAEVFHAYDTPDAAPPLRVIQIHGGDLPVIVNEAEAALIEQGADIFQHGNMLVRPSRERVECADSRQDMAVRLVPVKLPNLRDQFTAAAIFQRYSKTSEAWYAVDCPPDVAADYLDREGMWKVRRLAGVINCPTLRPDGTILDQPGHDAATGLLYLPNGVDFPAVPKTPTRDDALAALALLKSLIETFPFTDGASRSVALSGMLTALVRRSLPTAPLHAFTAPLWGSGKSMLVDLAALLATGSMAPVIAQGRDEAETEKRLGAALIAGDPIISLDNCDEPLSGVLLNQTLTQQVVQPRFLGQSKNVKVPGTAAMFATGNNLTVKRDTTRRVLMCSIDPGVERPELRVFKTDPVAILKRDRGRYVAAGLTILRAFIVAGRPQPEKPLASFGDWCRLVRDPLLWLGGADPVDTIEGIRAGDPEREQLAALIYHWHKVIGERPVTAKEVIAATTGVADESEEGQARAGLLDALLAVAASFVRGPTVIDPTRLGKYLGKHAGRVLNGRAIVREGEPAMGKQRWRIK